MSFDRESSLPDHQIALRYIKGDGPIPTDQQCRSLRTNLYESVVHVSELECKIEDLTKEAAELKAENSRLRADMANGVKPANVEIIDSTEQQLIGQALPCGQIMCMTQPGGTKIYVKCIIAGMPAFGGKCPIHAARAKESSASATAPSASSYAAITSQAKK